MDAPPASKAEILGGLFPGFARGAPPKNDSFIVPDTGATFEWLELHDAANSTLSFLRRAADGTALVCVLNATPCPREAYRLGVPNGGFWREVLNTDSAQFGGANIGNYGGAQATEQPWMGRTHSVVITLPPLAVVVLRGE